MATDFLPSCVVCDRDTVTARSMQSWHHPPPCVVVSSSPPSFQNRSAHVIVPSRGTLSRCVAVALYHVVLPWHSITLCCRGTLSRCVAVALYHVVLPWPYAEISNQSLVRLVCEHVLTAPLLHRHTDDVLTAPLLHRHTDDVLTAPLLHRHTDDVLTAPLLHRHTDDACVRASD
jgi:hypothetical protein